jgi:type VI secretion system Hcp family effector
MAFQANLKICGMDGASFDVEVMSFQTGLTLAEQVAAPQLRRTRNATFQDFSFVKSLDRYSPRLCRACAEGIPIDRVTLELSHTGRDVKFMEYRMRDCLVSSVRPGGSGQGYDLPFEEVSISYGIIEWVYFDQQAEVAEISATGMASRSCDIASAPTIASPLQYEPNTAFIIMWMDPAHPELDDVCNAIKEICGQFGVRASRADDIEHDERITDLILSRIGSSEFTVADLTGERPNVYYEVGYAQAIGKRPILFRRQDTRIHFDLSVHNVRAYKNITQLKDLLAKRFEAIMGRMGKADDAD